MEDQVYIADAGCPKLDCWTPSLDYPDIASSQLSTRSVPYEREDEALAIDLDCRRIDRVTPLGQWMMIQLLDGRLYLYPSSPHSTPSLLLHLELSSVYIAMAMSSCSADSQYQIGIG